MTAPLVLSRPRRAAHRASVPRPPTTPVEPIADDADRIAATATSLAVACLEIFAGVRRSESIGRWVDAELLAKIDRRARLRAEIAPVSTVRDHRAARTLQAERVRVCRVHATVAEATVMVRTQSRFRAVAVRLELIANRWTMTALETM